MLYKLELTLNILYYWMQMEEYLELVIINVGSWDKKEKVKQEFLNFKKFKVLNFKRLKKFFKLIFKHL